VTVTIAVTVSRPDGGAPFAARGSCRAFFEEVTLALFSEIRCLARLRLVRDDSEYDHSAQWELVTRPSGIFLTSLTS
jgi:hypothetical protein